MMASEKYHSKKFCVNDPCLVNTLPTKERSRLFCFPRADDIRRQWLRNMNRNDLQDLTYRQLLDRGYRVCEVHFENNQFQNELKLRLNVGQIPRPVRIQDQTEPDHPEPA